MKSLLSLRLSRLSFDGLETLANAVYAGLNGSAIYTTPVPSLLTLQNDIAAFHAAKTQWGTKGNRGSHQDYIDLTLKRDQLRLDLVTLASYCEARLVNLVRFALFASLIHQTCLSVHLS